MATTIRVMKTTDGSGTSFHAYKGSSKSFITRDPDIVQLALDLYAALKNHPYLGDGHLSSVEFDFTLFRYSLYFPNIIYEPLSATEIRNFCSTMGDCISREKRH